MNDKMLRSATAITVLLCLNMLAGSSCVMGNGPEDESLVVRLDFEKGSLPKNLVIADNAAIVSDESHGGSSSVTAAGTQPKLSFHTFAALGDIPLKGGHFYRLSAWAKTSDTVTRKAVHTQLIYEGEEKKNKDWAPWSPPNGIAYKGAANKWIHGSAVLRVPLSVGKCTLRLGAYLTKGQYAYFDDVELVHLPAALDANYVCYSDRQSVEVRLYAASIVDHHAPKKLRAEVIFKNTATGKVEITKRVELSATPEPLAVVDIDKVPAGKYDIIAQVVDANGSVLHAKEMPFEVFRNPPWAGNRLGILDPKDSPPAPWTDLKYKASRQEEFLSGGPAPEAGRQYPSDTVRCWGREHLFSPPPFPGRIKVLGEDILAGPIRLHIETEMGEFSMANCSWAEKESGPQKGTFTFSATDGGLRLTGVMEIEFDGMMKYSLKLTPASSLAVTVTKMSLEIPLKKRFTSLFFCPTLHGWSKRSELDSNAQWELDRFHPMILLGNEEKGLAWFAETDRNWKITSQPYFKCADTPAGRTLTVNFVDSQMRLTKPTEYVFGLQATPTRERPENWRALNFRTGVKENMKLIWAKPNTLKYFGFPQAPDDPAHFERLLAGYRRRGIKHVFIYQNGIYMPEQLPEWRYYWNEWLRRPQHPDRGVYTPIVQFDVKNPLSCDFLVHRTYEYLKRWKDAGVNGIYFDGIGAQKQRDDGWAIFAARDLLKRFYIINQQLTPEGMFFIHAGNFPPVTSFASISLSGEQYRHFLYNDPYYLSFMSLKQFRQEQVMDLGQVRMLLGQLQGPAQKEIKPTVHFTALAFLHDMIMYPHTTNHKVLEGLEGRRIAFGRAQSHFVGYWQGNGRVANSNPAIKISYYQRRDGLFVVVFNSSAEPAGDQLTLNLSGLQLASPPQAVLYDPLTGKETQAKQAESFPVSIDGYSMILVEIR